MEDQRYSKDMESCLRDMEDQPYFRNAEDLTGLGNVSGELPERKIIPSYCFTLPGLILKEYHIKEQGKADLSKEDNPAVHFLIYEELEKGNLKPLSGLGFLILSNDVLKICRWDYEHIDVVVPQIYTFENGLWKPKKVEEAGAFCSEEKKVYDHENNAWLRFLSSERTNQDKSTYLNDFLKG